jgi:hypothetical protein
MSSLDELGPLLPADESLKLEKADRARPIPGGEPDCPVCAAKMVRLVEGHAAPRSDDSPFRVRLVCSSAECGRWTVYDW